MRWLTTLLYGCSFILSLACRTAGLPAPLAAVVNCAEAALVPTITSSVKDFDSVLATENWSEDAMLVVEKYGVGVATCALQKIEDGSGLRYQGEPSYEEIMRSPRARVILSRLAPAEDAGTR